MALVQPITAKELTHFPRLCFEIFTPGKSLDNRKRNFPNVSNHNENDIFRVKFRPLFINKEIYDKKRGILKQAIDCGLVIEVPEAYGEADKKYYLLNSDISFIISNKGIEIKEDRQTYLKKYWYRVNINPKESKNRTEKIKDFIALPKKYDFITAISPDNSLPDLNSVSVIMQLFKWFIKDPIFAKKLLEASEKIPSGYIIKNELPGWKTGEKHKIYAAIKDGLLVPNSSYRDLYRIFPFTLSAGKIALKFAPSYNIFHSFSNYEDHTPDMKKCTPMQFLNNLTNEEYTINPNTRSMVFTSLVYNHENINYHDPPSTLTSNTKNIPPSQHNETTGGNLCNCIVIKSNKQLVEKTIFDFNHPVISKSMYDNQNNWAILALHEHFPANDKPNVSKG